MKKLKQTVGIDVAQNHIEFYKVTLLTRSYYCCEQTLHLPLFSLVLH